jgi:glycosyltransferase involved in cell wall biosynthesis
MVSIIVIGYNEGSRLTTCLNSISNIINSYSNLDFEVIYVDSKSEDNSIETAKSFPFVHKTFVITGKKNAAIARNIGAKESSGDILFFVDGDMELDVDFLSYAINDNQKMNFQVLTGHLDDYFYDYEGNFIGKSPRTYLKDIPNEIEKLDSNGGIFLIERKVWDELNGMNTKFRVNEDIDFSIRLKKLGICVHRLPYLITKHHTIDYRNEKRMWKNLKQGYGFYPGVLFRKHFFEFNFIIQTIRAQYTAILLFSALIFFFINDMFFTSFIVLYCSFLFMRALVHTIKTNINKYKFQYFLERSFLQFFLDLSFWMGFLFFFPNEKIEKYIAV